MNFINNYIAESKKILDKLDTDQILMMISILKETRENNGRLFILGVGGGAGSTDPVRVFWGQNVFHTAMEGGDIDRAGSAEGRGFTVGRRKDYGEGGVNEKPHQSTRVALVTRTAEVDLPGDENGMFSLPW